MPRIDVFLCSCAADPIRQGLRDAVTARWEKDWEMVGIHLLTPSAIGCTNKEFQGLRRKYAEEHSAESFYILAEDDCMPLGPDFVKRGMEVMQRHPDYAVLSPLLLPFPPAVKENDGEVSEGITAGGINFTRRGLIDVAAINSRLPWDECAQAEHLRGKGWKSGWMRNVKCNHLGATLSTLWPEPYTGKTSINET